MLRRRHAKRRPCRLCGRWRLAGRVRRRCAVGVACGRPIVAAAVGVLRRVVQRRRRQRRRIRQRHSLSRAFDLHASGPGARRRRRRSCTRRVRQGGTAARRSGGGVLEPTTKRRPPLFLVPFASGEAPKVEAASRALAHAGCARRPRGGARFQKGAPP